MCMTFTEQVEELQGMLTAALREVTVQYNKFSEVDTKFNAYYKKQEQSVSELKQEVKELKDAAQEQKYKYANHEEIFKKATDRGDKFERLYVELDKPYKDLKETCVKLKKQLIEFQEKFGFIDLTQLQYQVREAETAADNAKIKAQNLEEDLFEIKDKITEITR